MQAFRHTYTVEQNKILIELPRRFNHNSVEVIVLPIEKKKTKRSIKPISTDKAKQLEELLTIGVWSEEDLQPIIETNNLINQWKIEEF